MELFGLQKLSLLDFPEKTACAVFLGGCNFRCPFCQNGSLVLPGAGEPQIDEEEFFAFLKKRAGILDGVCITGGEPTLHKDLPVFAEKIRALGFAVKLDTNGSRPDVLRTMVEAGLVDYAAMDIKNARAKYASTCGLDKLDIGKIEQSAAFLMEGRIPYEFRTTVVRELHGFSDFEAIGRWLDGARAYYLQSYVDSEDVLVPGFSAYGKAELETVGLHKSAASFAAGSPKSQNCGEFRKYCIASS